MSGFIRDPLGDVQLIADNLRDRYKSGFPILKEIVQNADDAGASELTMGWHHGLKEAEHPLLRDPAIFFLNDAYLKDDDARGIRSIGLGTKADNKNAVGKFGLGMKSLFHLGEVFFFIGSDWQDHQGEFSKADVLNPWSTERRDWEHFSDHDKLLLEAALDNIKTKKKGNDAYTFIVWIPLRSASLTASRGEKKNYIINSDDYGTNIPPFLSSADLPERLGKLLPMLKRLKSISGYSISVQSSHKLFEVKLNDGAGRCLFPDLNVETRWQGTIRLESTLHKESRSFFYAGVESLVESEYLQVLKQHKFWPVSYSRAPNGAERQIPDKAKPHAAALLIGQPTSKQAKFTVQWAVFLPLGEQDTSQSKQVFSMDIPGGMSFDLLLHGYFFIDAGRVGIHGRQSIGSSEAIEVTSEEAATQEWNRQLANEGTLPSILPSVSFASSKLRLTNEQTLALSAGVLNFLNSDIGRLYHRQATANHQWIYQLTPEKRLWVLIPSQKLTRPIPTPTSSGDYERIWETLPGLSDLSKNVVLRAQDKPNIQTIKNSCWTDSEVNSLLNSVPNTVFETKILLGYLNKFLREVAPYGSHLLDKCTDTLIDLARRVLKEVRLVVLSLNQSAFKEFIGFIRVTYRWAFRLEKEEQALWNVIAGADTRRLIVPAFLDSKTAPCAGKPFFDDVVNCLTHLSQSQLDISRVEKATLEMLSTLSPDDKDQLIKRHDRLKLFRAYKPGKMKPHLASRRELIEQHQSRCLFRLGESGNFQLGEPLEAALLDHQITFINSEINKQLFSSKVPSCDTQGVISLLGKKPDLSCPNKRTALISKLDIEEKLNDAERLSVRYLLHGSKRDHNLSVELWSAGRDNPVWSVLHKETLSTDESWTIVPHEISHVLKISPVERTRIHLKEVNCRNVLDKLGEDIQLVDFSTVVKSQQEAEEILQYIEDETIWKNIPLHRVAGGGFTAIDKNCALKNDYPLPELLSKKITWIEPAHTRQVQELQEKYVGAMSASKAIELALTQDSPHQFQEFIVNQLGRVGSTANIIAGLRETPWLTANGSPCAPRHVIAASVDDWPQCYALSRADDTLLCFQDKLDLKPSALDQVKKLLVSDNAEIAEVAIEIAAQTYGYHVGSCKLSQDVLKQAATFRNAFDGQKGWELLIECYSNTEDTALDANLANRLVGHIEDPLQLVSAHQQLSENAPPEKVGALRAALLSAICQIPSARDLLSTLKLRTQGNCYRPAKQLCYGVVGAADSALLHEQDWGIIKSVLPEAKYSSHQAQSSVGMADFSSLRNSLKITSRFHPASGTIV